MGTYKDENGKTRVGQFLQGLGDVGKPILEAAAGLTGQPWLNNIAGLISTSKEVSEEQKKIAVSMYQLDLQDTQDARANETARDTNEYSSWLSKNIHEIIALVVIGCWMVTWFVKVVIDPIIISSAVMLILGYLYGRTQPEGKK